ncbi:MAG TPA: 2-oxoacid:acceptor oxidoreductase subunit alpha [Planctomycetota bacterium]|nr:2-oxoacid:acceptor oxidoreductase subunit alpha [Planctomycetota bacterium]
MAEQSAGLQASARPRAEVQSVVARFAGDSGDGMQLTGTQFAHEVAWAGNDLATLPNYPAEIRAPAGTLFGVSSFQIQFGSIAIHTPGDQVDVLMAMNPAAYKVHLKDLKPNGVLIVNSSEFTKNNLAKAGYAASPIEDPELARKYRFYKIDITKLTREALKDSGLNFKEIDRSKNLFCLGLVSWLYNRPIEPSIEGLKKKFGKKPQILEANIKALRAGYNYGETMEGVGDVYDLPPAHLPAGRYRQITGNQAIAIGLVAAAAKAGKPLVYGAYPITPASDILHELAMYKRFKVRTFQAEDEIAAIGGAIGASFAGAIGSTGTSGPGIALKSEAIGLAVMTELPLVIVDVQRGGPSTGLPTKTEQADLNQALFGRNGECPVIVLAPATPGDCFYMGYEAVRLAVKYMHPVMVLSDGYLANGAEPWKIPDPAKLPEVKVEHATEPEGFKPYSRDERTLSRPWAIPGTPGLEHRIGGIEKQHITGNVNYEPENHDFMVRLREAKVKRVAQEIPPLEILGEREGELLVVGWGCTYGAIRTAVEGAQRDGLSVSSIHIRHLNPLPPDLGTILSHFKKVLVPEINRGQLRRIIRAEFLVDAAGLNRVRGLPLPASEIRAAIDHMLGRGGLDPEAQALDVRATGAGGGEMTMAGG